MNTETAVSDKQETSALTNKGITDISSMLLPVEGRLLLLPGVAVAEIVIFFAPEADFDEEVPAWYLGNIYWRNQRVPLVSFETMMDGRSPFVSSHCRIAVLNNTGLDTQLNFFAILLQATPKLLRLTPEELSVDNEKLLGEGEKMHVIVAGQEAVIPDIAFIEGAINNYLQST